MGISTAVIVVLAVLIVIGIILILYLLGVIQRLSKEFQKRIETMIVEQQEQIEAAKKVSVNQSRSTLKGKIAEQLAPMAEGFPYLPSDARFLGNPVDYIIFRGTSDIRDAKPDNDEEVEVILLEVKQGSSRLSYVQSEIARAIGAGRVRFEICHVDESGQVEVQVVAKQE